jgi:hypothetical protein
MTVQLCHFAEVSVATGARLWVDGAVPPQPAMPIAATNARHTTRRNAGSVRPSLRAAPSPAEAAPDPFENLYVRTPETSRSPLNAVSLCATSDGAGAVEIARERAVGARRDRSVAGEPRRVG